GPYKKRIAAWRGPQEKPRRSGATLLKQLHGCLGSQNHKHMITVARAMPASTPKIAKSSVHISAGPPKILKGCAWGIVGVRGALRFVDPSPEPLELRRRRHTRDRHHRHDACHLRGYRLCSEHFRGAVRPPVEFSCHQLCGSERSVAQSRSDSFRGRRRLLRAPVRRTLLSNSTS